ncbi:MAG: hypothetical protein P3T54_02535 [Dehalogenimonas sp.]|uniref:WD40 repeat domain-containing protein n=1 Tax=Candidatus Dehalogenimonas loeffleri TaxID=3127115 RepID=A0ABZ2JA42_9CHLR|nr:hypothetical protein [Dehalogenimonas sp.]
MNKLLKWPLIFLGSLAVIFVVANVVSVIESRFWVKAKDCNATAFEIAGPASPVWQNSRGWAFDGDHLWIMAANASQVIKVNPATGATAGVVMLPSKPVDLSFDGTHIWVSSERYYYVIDIISSVFVELPAADEKGRQLKSAVGNLIFDGQYFWSGTFGVSRICRDTGEFLAWNISGGAGTVGIYDGQFLWGISQSGLLQVDPSAGSVVAEHALDIGGPLYYDGDAIWGIVVEGGVPNEYGGIHYTDDNFTTFLVKTNISQPAFPYISAKYELGAVRIKDITFAGGLTWLISDTGKVITFDPLSRQITESRQVFNRMMGDFSLVTDGIIVFALDYSSGTLVSLADWPAFVR